MSSAILRTTFAGACLVALATAAAPPLAAEETTLSVGTSMTPGIPLAHMLTDVLKPRIAELSGGAAALDVSLQGSLCSEKSCVEQVRLGQIDMATVSIANYGGFGQTFEILTLPYLFRDTAAAKAVFEDFLAEELRRQGEAQEGLKVIAIVPVLGFRNLQTNKEIHVPADLRGVKLRVTKSPLDAFLARAWGASPVPVGWAETYDALQTGMVDGIYVQNGMYLAKKFDEVANHVTLTGGAFTPMMIFMDGERFAELPDAVRTAIDTAAGELQADSFAIDAQFIDTFEKGFAEADVSVYEPSPEEMDEWRSAAAAAWVQAKDLDLYDPALARRILEAQPGTEAFIAELEDAGAL